MPEWGGGCRLGGPAERCERGRRLGRGLGGGPRRDGGRGRSAVGLVSPPHGAPSSGPRRARARGVGLDAATRPRLVPSSPTGGGRGVVAEASPSTTTGTSSLPAP